MPIKIKDSLPAQSILEEENIFVLTENTAIHQDIRPLNVLILNLMSNKIETETQLLRMLSNSPLQINVELLTTETYKSARNAAHLESFYTTFSKIKDRRFDGMIITGAPLPYVEFENVTFWDEVCMIMDWAETHVHSMFNLCWGAFAAYYNYYGILRRFYTDKKKLSGIYRHTILTPRDPLFRGFDDHFYAPHSREWYIDKDEILHNPKLVIMAESLKAGPAIVKTKDNRKLFVLSHGEYDYNTLQEEYIRDSAKDPETPVPENYFPDDDPGKKPENYWRSAAQLLYTNWLNYYVYQSVPYDFT
ncbi:MAG: homoserine O-succinyltransferase [Eubacteriales bacterium]|nr:homoserine O-succinyltransferase [Eubacteriales bacterium]